MDRLFKIALICILVGVVVTICKICIINHTFPGPGFVSMSPLIMSISNNIRFVDLFLLPVGDDTFFNYQSCYARSTDLPRVHCVQSQLVWTTHPVWETYNSYFHSESYIL